ncbi:hypothetical protein ACQKOE_13745 [Novosphingobium sp. NPDC080210]|uniref:hypothetical protein n=1 Tax=Novosphingobium sp. NPDC080210 TaxID=3390596 RepID=UPI003D049F86
MGVKATILRWQEVLLCAVRKWWRPITCIGIAGGAIVNLVVIPLVNWEVPNMAEAAAYVTAATAAFAVREWGKVKGVAE